MTRYERRQLGKGLLFVSPWIIGFCLFLAYPLVMSLYYSLCNYDILTSPVFIGLGNYKELLSDSIFWQSLYNTFFYALFAIPISLFTAFFFAVLLNCNIKCRGILRTIYYIPSLVPLVASAMIWVWILNGKFGLLNYFLSFLGIHGPDWLNSIAWTKPSVIFTTIWGVGNTMVIFLAGLNDVPKELYEAADIDGASFISKLKNVTIPLISPVIYFNLVMGIIGALQVFTVSYVMFSSTGGAGPDRSVLFYTVYLYNNAFQYNRMGYACAMAWIMFIIILILTIITTRAYRKKIHYGGL
ncbi:MAG: sugar ABC transporter permease [bacterium]|nr:sugar ABC transporter permease [bacterium]